MFIAGRYSESVGKVSMNMNYCNYLVYVIINDYVKPGDIYKKIRKHLEIY